MPLTSEGSVTATEDYDYIPKTLIEWMAQQSGYVPQYPHLKSCLAREPSIVPGFTCTPVAPVYASEVPDLTTSLSYTVTCLDCFHSGACSISNTPDAAAGPTQKATAIVEVQTSSSLSTALSRPTSTLEASIPASTEQAVFTDISRLETLSLYRGRFGFVSSQCLHDKLNGPNTIYLSGYCGCNPIRLDLCNPSHAVFVSLNTPVFA